MLESANTAGCAADVGDTLGQVSPLVFSGERFDVARLFAGDNAVSCFTDPQALRQAATHALIALKGVARCVLWIADRTAPYFASDGLHPNGAAHRHCLDTLKQRLHRLGVHADAWLAHSHRATASV